jgi:hypothetical protein
MPTIKRYQKEAWVKGNFPPEFLKGFGWHRLPNYELERLLEAIQEYGDRRYCKGDEDARYMCGVGPTGKSA